MNVDADVIAGRDLALSGMQTHPDSHRLGKGMIGEGPLDLSSGLNRFQGAREHDEEGVPLRADLGPIVFLDYVPEDAVVALKEIDVPILELLEEPGRPLDIGEQECHGACWQLPGGHGSSAREDNAERGRRLFRDT